jgi:hypothetical protein
VEAMSRASVVLLIGIWSLCWAEAKGQVFRVEGDIVHASLPWTDRLFDGQDGPLLAFPSDRIPVPYVGTLTVDAENSRASFEVSIDSCIAGSEYCLMSHDLESGVADSVFTPTTYRLAANLFEGILRNDASEVRIDYVAPSLSGVTSFGLQLDKTTGEGAWHWNSGSAEVCFKDLCAPSLPGNDASGTISAFRVVPEPTGLALALFVVGTIAALRLQAKYRWPVQEKCGRQRAEKSGALT